MDIVAQRFVWPGRVERLLIIALAIGFFVALVLAWYHGERGVQRVGDEVRITATLVNASDGSVLWSQRYDKPYKDLFALQDAITQSVATALKAKLLTTPGAVAQSDRPSSGNLDAYAAYLRGTNDFTPDT